ncbi:hypothetical protein [uncultured Desulfovibrio sp.]|uniref:hypothetical protein n=1 Tax=uncultured Desulfovibrio sp. TaxID=167968 RepID=UPI00266ECD57|nr:hypothetical protein [uncultured Desulfovibrio sp.]
MKLLSRLGSLLDGGLPLLLCLLALLAGYMHGRDTAEQEGKARIAALQTAWAEQERGRAEAVAAAEKSARERLAAATERGDKLAAELANTTRALDAARADLNRRIRHVSETARRDCPGLPAGWVRLYNEALGLAETGPDHSAGGGSSGSGGAADASGSAGAAGAGIQPDALTTPEDVLAHIRDYGHYCRRMEAGYRALITLHNGDSP